MKFLLPVLIILFTGCATTTKSPQSLNWSGNIAYEQLKYEVAKDYYESAIELAKNSNDKEYQSIAMYGLAKTEGRLCNFSQAEYLLKESIQIRNELFDTGNAKITQNIFELGRIYIAQEKWDLASIQYNKAIPMLEKFDMETLDPIGLSNLLEEYFQVLDQTFTEKAHSINLKIGELRKNNPNEKARYISNLYSKDCT
ncbi:tetratricopeptide repeat protein [Colwellia sp. Arc7-635]|uniref:tetratricopeptide repeat protein n=1 Tax=Colwellia sp. Arc7-635 TaxID=2497879 RepID=UPI000F84FD98|nr:tetratricopeptide repeat protein [Colwellia sp. Arc7-635]AZQ82950.1 tetratricopeptide repeat protein [Colwellia sp. Arc7-635]